MSVYAQFLREVEKRVQERVENLTRAVVSGAGVSTFDAYREKVGELRAYGEIAEIMKEAADAANDRSTKT